VNRVLVLQIIRDAPRGCSGQSNLLDTLITNLSWKADLKMDIAVHSHENPRRIGVFLPVNHRCSGYVT
jgi:hypothetical protein